MLVHPVVRLVVVSVTTFTPEVEYTIPVGLWSVEVAGAAPLPKFHAQVTPTTVPVLMKSTFAPVQAGAVEEKLVVGVALIVMVDV